MCNIIDKNGSLPFGGTFMQWDLTVLSSLNQDELFSAYARYKKSGTGRSDFLRLLYERGAQDDFSAYLYDLVLYDVNAFSVSCANSKLSPYVEKAYKADLSSLCELLLNEEDELFHTGDTFQNIRANVEIQVEKLKEFYRGYGYGDYVRYRAFSYENGGLRPIEAPSSVTLDDLKNYEEEKKIISSDIENFLQGLPYSNILLYGERGTGKSSTVHAMLNRYYDRGLRLVELSKENMLKLGKLKELLRSVPLKFIIYIDDLSLSAGDERISSLKAALEGCSEGNTENAMIVATSNRRHIVDEKFSQRDDSVHAGDSEQEELSLSDRFGISVLFTTTNKDQYLSIVKQLAADRKIDLPEDELCLLAERWAIRKGGRSPRRAKQFCDLAYSLTARGLPIEF